jgi:hypothetical protein
MDLIIRKINKEKNKNKILEIIIFYLLIFNLILLFIKIKMIVKHK